MTLNAWLAPGGFTSAPAHGIAHDAGFSDRPVDKLPGPEPSWLPEGMRLHRAGVLAAPAGPEVTVRAYSDGRAWVKVRSTPEWSDARPFGDLGLAARTVTLEDGGTAYIGEGGARVGLHAEDVDVMVTGSLAEAELLRVAASLGVTGLPLPGAPGAGADPAAVARARGLLVLEELDGFSAPAVMIDGAVVSFTYTGPGARGFVLTQAPGTLLSPPMEKDVRGVSVRRTAGRYTPSLGQLEWVEDGHVVSLRSATVPLAELVGIAETLIDA